MNRLTSLVIGLSALVFLSACGGVPPTFYYRVDTPLEGGNDTVPHFHKTLAVAQFGADALYETDKIVYRSSPYEARFYHYRRWVAPPKKIVTENVVRQFQASDLFKRVVRIPSPSPADYVLRGNVLAFEEWDEGGDWFGVVTLEFTLIDALSSEVVWEQVFSERTPAERKEPVAVVKAISESLDRVIDQSVTSMKSGLKANSTVELSN